MNVKDAVTAAGITYRQFDHWCRRGFLAPHLQLHIGSGNQRQLDQRDVARLCHLAQLVRFGITPDRAATILDSDQAHLVDEHLVITVDGVRLVMAAAA